MENNRRNETLHHATPAQWGRSIFIALLPVLACFLGGAGTKWAEGIVLLLLGAFLIIQPPRRSLGWIINGIFIAFAFCAFASYLPERWFFTPAWRAALIQDFGVALPNSITPQPWLTAGCFASLIAALAWLYRVSAQELELRVARFQFRLFAAGVVTIAAISILLHFTQGSLPFWQNERGFGPFPNPNQTADLFGVTSVLILAAAQDDIRYRRMRWLVWAIALAVVTMAIVLNSSRAGVLILVASSVIWAGIVAICVACTGRLARAISLVLLCVAVVLILGGATWDWLGLQRLFGNNLRSDVQWPHFRDGWKLISSSPWTGIGLSNFERLFPLVVRNSNGLTGVALPESDWFWAWVELGFLGIALVLVGMVLLIRRAWPLQVGTNQRFRIAALIGALMFALHGLINTSAHNPGTAYVGLFLLGLSLHRPTQLRISKITPWIFRILGLFLLVVGLSWVIAWRTMAMQPGAIGVHNAKQLASIAARGRNFAETIRLTTDALDWAPLDSELYYLRATAELSKESPSEIAFQDFRRARFLDPDSYSVPLREGFAWLALRPELAASAWAEALHRAGSHRHEVFRSIILTGSRRNLTARGIIEQLAFKDPSLALEYLAQLPATEFHDGLMKFLEPDSELTRLGAKEKQQLFQLWRERGGLSSLVPLIERHPDWLPLAWRAVASSRAAAGNYQEAYALAKQFGSEVTFPPVETDQSVEQLRARAYHGPDNFNAGFSLYRRQMDRGETDEALATARHFTATDGAPPYFHLLEAQACAAKQNWQQSWDAWVAFEKAKSGKR